MGGGTGNDIVDDSTKSIHPCYVCYYNSVYENMYPLHKPIYDYYYAKSYRKSSGEETTRDEDLRQAVRVVPLVESMDVEEQEAEGKGEGEGS